MEMVGLKSELMVWKRAALLYSIFCCLVESAKCAEQPQMVCEKPDTPCKCEDNVLKCANQNLETAYLKPKMEVIEKADLQDNKITELAAGKVLPGHEHQLRCLDFRKNYIHRIERNAFQGMFNLQTLHLSSNKIRELSSGVFESLGFGLIVLDLSLNLLDRLDDSPFSSLSELKYLYLDGNRFSTLSGRSFDGLASLVELTLDNGQLSKIAPDAFLSLKSLELLSLKGNRLSTIPQLKGLANLNKIILSGNPLLRVTSHSFKWAPGIKYLQMRHMDQLIAIDDCAFCGMHNLEHLAITDCARLQWIDPYAFDSSQYFQDEIQLIDFSNNSLSKLNEKLLPWKNVSTIALNDNPWKCDCNLSWLKSYESQLQGDAICAYPENLRNRSIRYLTLSDFGCGKAIRFSYGRVATIVFLTSVCSFAWLALWYWYFKRKSVRSVLRKFFCRQSATVYAYSNLAMSDDTDQLVAAEEKVPNPEYL